MKKLVSFFCVVLMTLLFSQCEKERADVAYKEKVDMLDFREGIALCAQIFEEHDTGYDDTPITRTLPEEIDFSNDDKLLKFGSTLLGYEQAYLQVTRADALIIIHYRPEKQIHVYRCFGDSVIINRPARHYTTIQMSKT